MSITLSAWYASQDPLLIDGLFDAALQAAGFRWCERSDGRSGSGESHPRSLWLKGARVRDFCSDRTEDHRVVELIAGGFRRPAPHFLDLFHAIVCAAQPCVAECMLAATSADVFPWFTHSYHRKHPLNTVVELGRRWDDPSTVHEVGSPGYWAGVGPRLHFVAADTLARVGGPTPERHAREVGARFAPSPGGWIFDCGWTYWTGGSQQGPIHGAGMTPGSSSGALAASKFPH